MVQISQVSATKLIPTFNDSTVRETLSAKKSSSDFMISVASASQESCFARVDAFLEKAWLYVKKTVLAVWYYIKGCFCSEVPYKIPELELETLFDDEAIEKMREGFWGLGKENMWEIIIDGEHHDKGRLVFDKGLHGRSVEPGFVTSMENHAFPLISKYLGTRTTVELVLEMHKAACWHFKGDHTDTLMGSEKIGVFRDENDSLTCKYNVSEEITLEDWKEMADFRPKLNTLEYTDEEKTCIKARYITKNAKEMEKHLTDFLDDFYEEIGKAGSKKERIRACGRLAKKMDWAHLTRDGATRLAMLTLQKHLTEYAGHPGIFEDPNMMTKMGLEKFCDYIEEALQRWEDRKEELA